jgi:hypothetical protein
VPEVLTVPIYKNAAVSTHILGVPAAEIGIEESVRHAAQRLHRRLKAEATDVELDAAFVCCLVHLHGCDLTVQLGSPRTKLSEPFVTLFGHLGEPLGTLLGDLRETLGALLLRFFEHVTGLAQNALHGSL